MLEANVPAPEKVLVLSVDDQEQNLVSLEQVLNSDEIEVISVRSGAEALRRLLKHQFCCILLDIRMPDMDGFETAAFIRADPDLAQTPIIFVTAEVKDQESQFTGYNRGAVDFLVKPLSPQVILAKVRVFAELYRQKKALDQTALISELNAQLKDTNEQLLQFTFIASHDMQEPLRRIHCLVDLLRADEIVLGKDGLREICDDLSICAHEALNLAHDFRELTTIVSTPFLNSLVDIGEISHRIAKERQADIERRGIEFRILDVPKIKGDEALIRNLLAILVDNALLHTGQAAVTIEISASWVNHEWVISVRNTGSKISEAMKAEIFKPFVRSAHLQKWQHLGLGLTKAKKIVDRHRGRIWVENEGESVAFKFTLAEVSF